MVAGDASVMISLHAAAAVYWEIISPELRPGCGITAVQSICSQQPIPVLFITGRPGDVRIRMPGYALVEKPFSADHIMEATRLTLDSRDG